MSSNFLIHQKLIHKWEILSNNHWVAYLLIIAIFLFISFSLISLRKKIYSLKGSTKRYVSFALGVILLITLSLSILRDAHLKEDILSIANNLPELFSFSTLVLFLVSFWLLTGRISNLMTITPIAFFAIFMDFFINISTADFLVILKDSILFVILIGSIILISEDFTFSRISLSLFITAILIPISTISVKWSYWPSTLETQIKSAIVSIALMSIFIILYITSYKLIYHHLKHKQSPFGLSLKREFKTWVHDNKSLVDQMEAHKRNDSYILEIEINDSTNVEEKNVSLTQINYPKSLIRKIWHLIFEQVVLKIKKIVIRLHGLRSPDLLYIVYQEDK